VLWVIIALQYTTDRAATAPHSPAPPRERGNEEQAAGRACRKPEACAGCRCGRSRGAAEERSHAGAWERGDLPRERESEEALGGRDGGKTGASIE